MRSHLWIQTLSRLLIITSAEPSQNKTRTAKSRDLLINILTRSTYMVATCIPLASNLLCLCLRTTTISLAFHLLCLYLVANARPLTSQLPYLCLVTSGMPLASQLLYLQPYGWRCNIFGLPIRLLLDLVFTLSQQVEVQFISTRLKKLPISSNNRELEAPEPTILHKPSR